MVIFPKNLHIYRIHNKELFPFVRFSYQSEWLIDNDLLLKELLLLLLLQLLNPFGSQLIGSQVDDSQSLDLPSQNVESQLIVIIVSKRRLKLPVLAAVILVDLQIKSRKHPTFDGLSYF